MHNTIRALCTVSSCPIICMLPIDTFAVESTCASVAPSDTIITIASFPSVPMSSRPAIWLRAKSAESRTS